MRGEEGEGDGEGVYNSEGAALGFREVQVCGAHTGFFILEEFQS